ncbi:hypothetical protein [Amaricoccus solimangrovi]|uniref:hypothetical protein n=1 Tax=Amaricoccus solimangrovi TaxID=2589815 RepID=UPI001F2E9338|nr:hypothetical protein [Amaricoccus solimangrovi]
MEFSAHSYRHRTRPCDMGRVTANRLLRAAFPNMRVEERRARAALYTGRTEKTVQNWMDGVHDMKLGDAAMLFPLIAAEKLLKILYHSKD